MLTVSSTPTVTCCGLDLRCPLKTHRYSIDIVHGATGREWEFEEAKSGRKKLGHGEYALEGHLSYG